MFATTEQFGFLVRGARWTQMLKQVRRALPRRVSRRVRLWTQWQEVAQQSWRTLYIVSSLRHLTDEEELSSLKECGVGSECRFLAFVDELPTESIPEHLFRLRVRSGERLHLAQRRDEDEIRSLLRRFLQGLGSGSGEPTVADAWWESDRFVVLSPSFERLRVPLGSLPAQFQTAHREILERFQIDQYGDFVYWPRLEVHMGWDQLAQAADPMARLQAEQRSADFNSRYATAIRALRKSSGLTQRDIKGLDERTVRRIEQGQTRATANAIAKLAKAHRMETSEYMAELSRRL